MGNSRISATKRLVRRDYHQNGMLLGQSCATLTLGICGMSIWSCRKNMFSTQAAEC